MTSRCAIKNKARRHVRRNRGFATMWVIFMVPLIASTIAVMAQAFHHDAQRSQVASLDAQLHQLLLAGATASHQYLQNPQEIDIKPVQVSLPNVLASAGAKLQLQVVDLGVGEVRIRVEASLSGRDAHQTLRYKKTDSGYLLLEAKLYK